MSDQSVANALRSNRPIVLVEAPAGCGKTYQAAEYAKDIAASLTLDRLLILTHTHAACDTFASRTRSLKNRVEIRTIDSLITQIATAYHKSLGLPKDVASWARKENNGHEVIASKVETLLRCAPMVASALAQRYPFLICDEHQDSNAQQHGIVLALHRSGSRLRVFGDPLQSIYDKHNRSAAAARWADLTRKAGGAVKLETPHRWADGAVELGTWILNARQSLERGLSIDLRTGLPRGLRIIHANNIARRHGQYQIAPNERRPIDTTIMSEKLLLVLSAQNKTVRSLRAFFNRSIAIWEGHTRERLDALVGAMTNHAGNPGPLAEAVVEFLGAVAVGFSPSAFGNAFLAEVDSNCSSPRRGKAAIIQELARLLLESPDHRGVAATLNRVDGLLRTDPAFKCIKIDHAREFREAMRLAEFDEPEAGLAELSRRRTYAHPCPSARAISTIHKAKGLECDHVLLLPCDSQHFTDSDHHRCLLYVALSRAKRTLTIVVPRVNPSPLIAT